MIFIDIGHGLQSDGTFDPGAIFTDNNQIYTERGCAEQTGAHLKEILGAEAAMVPLDLKGYLERHQWVAHQDTPGAYLQLHFNAGGGPYCLVRPDARSSRGKALASAISSDLAYSLPGVAAHRSDELYATVASASASGRKPTIRKDGTKDWSWWRRGHICIAGIYPIPNVAGLLVEPAFVDTPAHRHLLLNDGPRLIAEVLAASLRKHLNTNPDGRGATR